MTTGGEFWGITADGLRDFQEKGARVGVSAEAWAPVSRNDPAAIRMAGQVAVIQVRGVIMRDAPAWAVKAGYASDTRLLRDQAVIAAESPEVASVLMVIDSPGGSVAGLSELGDALYALRQRKSLVAAVDNLAASAGYYLAAQADRVFSGRMDLVGSIGTIVIAYDVSKMFTNAGIQTVVIATGALKGTGVPGSELTASQRAYLQEIVDQYFGDFKSAIGRGRPGV